MSRRTVTVQVTAEIEEGDAADFAARLADAAEHTAGAYWATATLEVSAVVLALRAEIARLRAVAARLEEGPPAAATRSASTPTRDASPGGSGGPLGLWLRRAAPVRCKARSSWPTSRTGRTDPFRFSGSEPAS